MTVDTLAVPAEASKRVGKLTFGSEPSSTMAEQFAAIRLRQSQVPDLITHRNGVSAHIGTGLSPGCLAGQDGKWIAVFVGHACNAKCTFCPQAPKPKRGHGADADGNLYTSFEFGPHDRTLARLLHAVQLGDVTAIGYSGGEPLMYVDRVEQFANTVGKTKKDVYQYVYTNGILASELTCRRLADANIQEIRFDIAATNFSEKVLRNVERAKPFFDRVTVEIPAIRDIDGCLEKHGRRLINTGVSQINLCELVINEHNYSIFREEPYYIVNPYEANPAVAQLLGEAVFAYRRAAPIWSRDETYKVMERAVRESWNIVINDIAQIDHFKSLNPIALRPELVEVHSMLKQNHHVEAAPAAANAGSGRQ
jgi:sulfatase maturation enzyme AslB (radical SAM superfamily)